MVWCVVAKDVWVADPNPYGYAWPGSGSDDSGIGTALKPYATVMRAIQDTVDGDRVVLKVTYNGLKEVITLNKSVSIVGEDDGWWSTVHRITGKNQV